MLPDFSYWNTFDGDQVVRVVLQRVASAHVQVHGQTVSAIQRGLLCLVGVGQHDTEAEARWLAQKTAEMRIFADELGKMNRSLIEVGGSALVVSQFTLLADCRHGRRPAFTAAGPPDLAEALYLSYAKRLTEHGISVQCGIFAADMQVGLVNDGPVTILLDRDPRRE